MSARRPSFRWLSWLVGLALALTGCSTGTQAAKERIPLLLISLDGFRWDYLALHPEETPHLRELARR